MAEQQASGSFEVRMTPETAPDAVVGRMSLDKRFHGDLDATGIGEMLVRRTAVEGSAGYVAIEQVVGTLGGREGGFALQHSGIMDRGKPALAITVVPDSATGALTGLSGSMTIEIIGGQHHYKLRYQLPD